MIPTGSMATAQAQAHAAVVMAACADGDCRYWDPQRSRQQCEHEQRATCLGYQAHVYLEPEGPVLRWSRCPRFWGWWRVELERIRRRRQLEAETKRGRGPKPA